VIADRTACSILTLFIVIATFRPLNKKIRLLSVRESNNYCGSASAIRSPHTSVARAVESHSLRHCVIVSGGSRGGDEGDASPHRPGTSVAYFT